MLVWTKPIVNIFNSEPGLEAIAIQYIRIAAVGWIMMGFMFALMNTMQSAGDTTMMMIFSILDTWLVTILLAWLLPRYTDLGVLGIRWAMSASVIVGGLINVFYFRTGRWKKKKV